MEVCPTQNEQMLDIIDIRRNQVMIEGEFPRSFNPPSAAWSAPKTRAHPCRPGPTTAQTRPC